MLKVLPHRHDALVVEPVEPPGAFGPIGHQTGLLEQPQVPRHGRPADRQLLGQLADRPVARAQQLDDRPAVRVPKGVEGVSGQGMQRHRPRVTEMLR
jgi:hypothetical protein